MDIFIYVCVLRERSDGLGLDIVVLLLLLVVVVVVAAVGRGGLGRHRLHRRHRRQRGGEKCAAGLGRTPCSTARLSVVLYVRPPLLARRSCVSASA